MRFGTLAGRLVLIRGSRAIDVERASGGRFAAHVLTALASWDELTAWAAGTGDAEAVEVREADLGPPVPLPRQVFAVALNYRPHAAEAGFEAPESPLVFTKFPSCITGPVTEVELPPGKVDWEIEVVAVIGRGGSRIPREQAWDAVAGLTVGQDLSERVLQSAGKPAQFSLGKSYPGFGPTGPALVTLDEFADRGDIGFECRLDGETVQSGRTSEMIFPIDDLVFRLSGVCRLFPGDLIFTGTPAGVGNRRNPPRYLQPGETLVSSVEGIGEIRQHFRDRAERSTGWSGPLRAHPNSQTGVVMIDTTDVVVVGYGPAGAAAAIAAREAGAEVVVLEAGPTGGGNAVYSGGFLFDVPGDACVEHLDALCFGRTDRDVLVAYATGLHENAAWLAGIDAPTEVFDPPPSRLPASLPSWPSFPGGASIRYRVVSGGTERRGAALWRRLDEATRASEVPVRYETPAADLVVIDDVVAGVRTSAGDTLRARGGVVLACGGFEANHALADAYLPLATQVPVGHLGNDGAGLRMAAAAGAALWHMYGFFGWFAFNTPDFANPFAIDFFGASHLFVDAQGRRFGDETGYEVHDRLRALSSYLPRNTNRPSLPSWAIFDEAARVAGPLNGLLGTPNEYTWSADNSAEIDRGWIVAASSVVELAAQIGVDPVVLDETMSEYDASTRSGSDARFGRARDTLVPLDTSRLYAIETWPAVAGTTGGPRHDAMARVVRPDASPIVGLYAAGGVSMVWGHLIDHGGGLTDALVVRPDCRTQRGDARTGSSGRMTASPERVAVVTRSRWNRRRHLRCTRGRRSPGDIAGQEAAPHRRHHGRSC